MSVSNLFTAFHACLDKVSSIYSDAKLKSTDRGEGHEPLLNLQTRICETELSYIALRSTALLIPCDVQALRAYIKTYLTHIEVDNIFVYVSSVFEILADNYMTHIKIDGPLLLVKYLYCIQAFNGGEWVYMHKKVYLSNHRALCLLPK